MSNEISKLDLIIDRVNWDLLYQQKLRLLDVIELTSGDEEGFSTEQIEALEGILHLLDNLQDAAEEDGIWEHPMQDDL